MKTLIMSFVMVALLSMCNSSVVANETTKQVFEVRVALDTLLPGKLNLVTYASDASSSVPPSRRHWMLQAEDSLNQLGKGDTAIIFLPPGKYTIKDRNQEVVEKRFSVLENETGPVLLTLHPRHRTYKFHPVSIVKVVRDANGVAHRSNEGYGSTFDLDAQSCEVYRDDGSHPTRLFDLDRLEIGEGYVLIPKTFYAGESKRGNKIRAYCHGEIPRESDGYFPVMVHCQGALTHYFYSPN